MSARQSASGPDSEGIVNVGETLDTRILKDKDSVMNEKSAGSKTATAHIDVNIIKPTPPKMTRLPSLKQLSTHLHCPSPLSAGSSTDTHSVSEDGCSSKDPDTPTPAVPGPVHASPSTHDDTTTKPHVTPPKLKVAVNPIGTGSSSAVTQASASGSGTSPYTASPSSRLKLPMSAMTRSHSHSSVSSGSITHPLPPIPPFGGKKATDEKTLTALDKNSSDPFASPGPESGTMSRGASSDGYIKGYKDVPSLAAIRERVSYGKSSGKNIAAMLAKGDDAKVCDKENVQPARPVAESAATVKVTKAPEHPLGHAWTLYFDSKTLKPSPSLTAAKDGGPILGDYEKSLVTVGKFDTVEGFARHVNNVRLPSSLSKNSNYHMFKDGIRPMWEDPANAQGGKWVLLFKSSPQLLDHSWANLTMALVGEMLDPDDEVCGVVASTKPKADRIQIWTRGRKDVERINRLGKKIIEVLALEGKEMDFMSMEFQYNIANPNPPPNTFFTIPFGAPRSTSFSGFPPTSTNASLNGSTSTLPHPHAPPTPSKLGKGSSVASSPDPGRSPGRLHHPSLPAIPKSPTLPHGTLGGSGLGLGLGMGMGMGHGLPKPPRSASPRSPTFSNGIGNSSISNSNGGGSTLAPPGMAQTNGNGNASGSGLGLGLGSGSGREMRRLSAGNAFAGPMGGAAVKSGFMKKETGTQGPTAVAPVAVAGIR